MSVRHVQIDNDRCGQRLDNYLISILKGVPKSRIYRAIRKGEVRVNGARVKAEYRLQENDKVRVPPLICRAPADPIRVTSQLRALLEQQIVFEDDRFLVLDKPSGIPVQGGRHSAPGIQELITAMRPKASIALVHRIDKGTSGCLVLAKKRSALRELHALLRARRVHKQYLALLKGPWQGGAKAVDFPLLKSRVDDSELMVRVNYQQGKVAKSRFIPLCSNATATLALVEIETGRTHQIRVHAAKIGHPVAGDDKYGDKAFNTMLKSKGLNRLFLHAASIAFCDSLTQAPILALGASLPPSLRSVLLRLGLKTLR